MPGTAVARTEVTAVSQVSEAQTRSEGTERLTEHGGRCVARRSEVQPSWHATGRDQEEDGRAGPPARIPGGLGLDVVRNLGIGKVGRGPGDGRGNKLELQLGQADVLRRSWGQRAMECPFLAS